MALRSGVSTRAPSEHIQTVLLAHVVGYTGTHKNGLSSKTGWRLYCMPTAISWDKRVLSISTSPLFRVRGERRYMLTLLVMLSLKRLLLLGSTAQNVGFDVIQTSKAAEASLVTVLSTPLDLRLQVRSASVVA